MIKNKLIKTEEREKLRPRGKFRTIRYYLCANPECDNIIECDPRKYNMHSHNDDPVFLTCCCRCNAKANSSVRGVENPFSQEETKQKLKKIFVDKYGVENPAQAKCVKEKIKSSFIKNFGYDNPQKCPAISKRIRETCKKRYGHEYFVASEQGKKAVKEAHFDKYGIWWFSSEGGKECLENYIKKYGKIDGKRRWEERSEKCAQTVENYIRAGYTIDEATEKVENWKKHVGRSKENLIKKYGNVEGKRRYREYCKKWAKGRASGSTSKLEKRVVEELKKRGIEIDTQFAISRPTRGACVYDIFYEGKIVEINGSFWHADPKIYSETDILNFPLKAVTAKEIWEKDLDKKKLAENNGFKVMCVWESDINKNFRETINNIVAFLNYE